MSRRRRKISVCTAISVVGHRASVTHKASILSDGDREACIFVVRHPHTPLMLPPIGFRVLFRITTYNEPSRGFSTIAILWYRADGWHNRFHATEIAERKSQICQSLGEDC